MLLEMCSVAVECCNYPQYLDTQNISDKLTLTFHMKITTFPVDTSSPTVTHYTANIKTGITTNRLLIRKKLHQTTKIFPQTANWKCLHGLQRQDRCYDKVQSASRTTPIIAHCCNQHSVNSYS